MSISRSVSSTLIDTLLAAPFLYRARLVLITLANGLTIARTMFDRDITFTPSTVNGAANSTPFNYLSTPPYVRVSGMRSTLGVQVDTCSLELFVQQNQQLMIGTRPLLQAFGEGVFDNAQVQIERVYMPPPFPLSAVFDVSAGSIPQFLGNIGDVDEIDAVHVKFTVNDLRKKLNQPFPAHIFQPDCNWTMYDEGCGLNKATYGVNGTVAAGSGPLLLNTSCTAQADNYFNQGNLIFTSGANEGVTVSIRQSFSASGEMLLFLPLPNPPVAGDAFTAYPSCGYKVAGCQAVPLPGGGTTDNSGNYFGTPFVPPPETAA